MFTQSLKDYFPKLAATTCTYSCVLPSAAAINSPENKTRQDHTGKLIPDYQ